MNRRGFLKFLGLFFPTIFWVGCGSGSEVKAAIDPDDNNTTGGGGGAASCTTGAGVIYTNVGHAHTTSPLTQLEIEEALPGSYNLMGGAHSHMVDLTAQDFLDLKNGMTITKTSNSHGHMVDIVC